MCYYDTLDRVIFQNDLTEELTIENSDIVTNLAATLGVLGNKPPRKEQSENTSRVTRKQIWEELFHKATKMRIKRETIVRDFRNVMILTSSHPYQNLRYTQHH